MAPSYEQRSQTTRTIVNLNEMCRHIRIRPSTSLRYAQDEWCARPFVLSVTRRVKSKHERQSEQMI